MKAPAMVAAAASLVLSACDTINVSDVPRIPGPSKKVTRADAIEIARTYAELEWTPEERHAFHGTDEHKVSIHTPDAGFRKAGLKSGYWKAGHLESGMPYKWGGFDTPRSFARGLKKGRFAGDIATNKKRKLRELAASPSAVGIDCSGFVSRCWRLDKPYSTRELHKISRELSSYDELQSGDILNLHDKHVLLFSHWVERGRLLYVYEAGAYPEWKVSGNRIYADWLQDEGYVAYRYENIRDGHPGKSARPRAKRDEARPAAAETPDEPVENPAREGRDGWWLPGLVSSLGDLFDDRSPLDRKATGPDEAAFKRSAARRRGR
ncbi:MAG: hypothetical protein HKO57_10415 [Akkermansiaceae bacterium]|nr:hypothetical protein [Akkermansiaceae bacterium]